MSYIRKIVITLCLLSGMCASQTVGASDQETIRLLVEQVKELQESVKALQAKQMAPPVALLEAPPTAPVPPQPVEDAVSTPQIPITSSTMHELHGIQWRGFGEVNYKLLNQREPELSTFGSTPGSAGSFFTGDFALLLTSRINDKASVLSEIVLGEQLEQLFHVDLERILFKTTVDRPLITEYAHDGGPLPTQAVGVSTTGLIPSGRLGLNYIFEYGSSDTNRPHVDGSPGGDDENNGNHVNIGLFARPDAIPGLQIGGSFYHDKVSNLDTNESGNFGQTVVNAHVVYIGRGFEFLNEGFLIRHKEEPTNAVLNMPAFYSQVSKRLGHIRPFFRYQYLNVNPRSILEDILLRYGPSFGARYDFDDNIAFKAQLDHTVRKGKPDLNALQLQLVFAF